MSEDIVVEFVTGPGVDVAPEEIDQLTQALRAEILQLDEVDTVDQATAGPAPAGTKGLDIAALGALVVGIAPGIQAVSKVIDVVRGWLADRSPATPPLKMTIGDKSIEIVPDKEQQDALVRQFVASLQQID